MSVAGITATDQWWSKYQAARSNFQRHGKHAPPPLPLYSPPGSPPSPMSSAPASPPLPPMTLSGSPPPPPESSSPGSPRASSSAHYWERPSPSKPTHTRNLTISHRRNLSIAPTKHKRTPSDPAQRKHRRTPSDPPVPVLSPRYKRFASSTPVNTPTKHRHALLSTYPLPFLTTLFLLALAYIFIAQVTAATGPAHTHPSPAVSANDTTESIVYLGSRASGTIRNSGATCRTDAGVWAAQRKRYRGRAEVRILCQRYGQEEKGNVLWDYTEDGCFVSDSLVTTGHERIPNVPLC